MRKMMRAIFAQTQADDAMHQLQARKQFASRQRV
jgi:hypothetical protein